MATFTAHYNLRKPAVSDLMTIASDINGNMDIIDAALFDHEGRMDFVEACAPTLIRKPSNENVTSSTAMQADDHLVAAISAGTWLIDFFIAYDGAAAGDIQTRIAWDGSATAYVLTQGLNTNATAASGEVRHVTRLNDPTSPTTAIGHGADASNVRLMIHVLLVSTSATTCTLEWAQLASNATPTSIKEGSHVVARRIA